MNIKEAKQEIISAVRAYLHRNDAGQYDIPAERQRPILLMGPPGIGKTAIMEQAARECGINLVSYTITHHTRQSAIGLPFIARRTFDGVEQAVTEYTMSEIIAEVYAQIERSGVREGILFLDEINCVSETLAPTMLQFLQYKTFGAHRVPDGFVIVTAGNPLEYNRSAREFDMVTLDRVRRIDVEADYGIWKEYAYQEGIHGAVIAYLEIRKDHFYVLRTELEGRFFVTPRGWEDLSRVIAVHEALGLPVEYRLAVQYLQDPEVAESFAAYYALYRKYRNIYQIPRILDGAFPDAMSDLKDAPFDEKLSIISLLIERLNEEFRTYAEDYAIQTRLHALLSACREDVLQTPPEEAEAPRDAAAIPSERPGASLGNERAGEAEALRRGVIVYLRNWRKAEEAELQRKRTARLLSRMDERILQKSIRACKSLEELLAREVPRPQKRVPAQAGEQATPPTQMPAQAGEQATPPTQTPVRAGEQTSIPVQTPASAQTRMWNAADFDRAKEWFAEREEARVARAEATGTHLTNAFAFLDRVFGQGQELVIFLSELAAGYYSLKFVSENGNDAYDRYNQLLLLNDRREALRREILSI